MDLLLPRFFQRYMQRPDDFSRRLIVIVSGLNKSRWRNSERREASHGSEKNSFGYLLTCSLFSTWNLTCTEVIRFPTRRIFPKRDNLIVDSRKRISLSSGTLVFMRLRIELFTASRFVSSKSLGPSHGCEHGRTFVRANADRLAKWQSTNGDSNGATRNCKLKSKSNIVRRKGRRGLGNRVIGTLKFHRHLSPWRAHIHFCNAFAIRPVRFRIDSVSQTFHGILGIKSPRAYIKQRGRVIWFKAWAFHPEHWNSSVARPTFCALTIAQFIDNVVDVPKDAKPWTIESGIAGIRQAIIDVRERFGTSRRLFAQSDWTNAECQSHVGSFRMSLGDRSETIFARRGFVSEVKRLVSLGAASRNSECTSFASWFRSIDTARHIGEIELGYLWCRRHCPRNLTCTAVDLLSDSP